MKNLPLELKKIGLKEKEAKVYLAVLSLKYTPAQKIAKEAKISRPAVYEILKDLKNKGLVVENKEKNKRYFSGESPDRLLNTLQTQKKELKEKEREFLRIINDLKNTYQTDQQSQIQEYKGKNAVDLLLEDLTTTANQNIYAFASNESPLPFQKRNKIYKKIKKRLNQIKIKEINTLDKPLDLPHLKTKTVSAEKMPFQGVVFAYNKIIMLESSKKAYLINNPQVLNLLKSFFELY
jgi:sugar-specific transcriptional regulator TrmB